MSETAATSGDSSVDPAEIAKFARMAEAWWDPAGKFRPLHRLNPTRLAYIRDRATIRFGREAQAAHPLAGLRLIDIGCGGGLLCEPLSRLGATVTGIDASGGSISAARRHAGEGRLEIDYRQSTAEALAASGERFDVVLCMEVIAACAELVSPGGLLIAATLNRTAKAFAMAIVGAEYLLGWLPRGTHDWRKFLRPSELSALIRPRGLRLAEAVGVVYSPITGRWRLAPGDLDVNYMMCFERD
jgi:2-polyprenyl-6-hydroxyphenyl methylase/3-demethylubiquinone-9 3-methyltransferase